MQLKPQHLSNYLWQIKEQIVWSADDTWFYGFLPDINIHINGDSMAVRANGKHVTAPTPAGLPDWIRQEMLTAILQMPVFRQCLRAAMAEDLEIMDASVNGPASPEPLAQ